MTLMIWNPSAPPCSYVVGRHDGGSWAGYDKPCGSRYGQIRKDPRQDRYDVALCEKHLAIVLEE